MQYSIAKIPTIHMADVCFIRPISLPNFAIRFEDIKKSQFSFLYSLKDYVQYYTDLESKKYSESKRFAIPYYIENLGSLEPLQKRHTLNSYWRWIRFILKNEKSASSNPPETLLLLPLKIDIDVSSIKSNGIDFPVKIFVYIFPFGSCCVNMNVKMKNIDLNFDEFTDLYHKFLRYNIAENKTFKLFSADLVQKINDAIFGEGEKLEVDAPIHTLLFIKSTSSQLKFDRLENLDHIMAISALLKGKKVNDISSIKPDLISEELMKYRWPDRRKRELLFFTAKSSLLYPSTEWTEGLSSSRKKKHKLSCMRDNYQSFFNLTFAANKFLHDAALPNKYKLPAWRLELLRKCFLKHFPENYSESSTPVYFRHAFDPLAKSIRLYDSLQKLALP